MAWLGAIPRPATPPGKKPPADPPPSKSRLETMREQGIAPPDPFAEMPQIVEWLMEIGPIEASSAGRAPLSWGAINEWCIGSGADLAPWQRRLIRRLSVAFAAETQRAENPDAPHPSAAAPIDRPAVGRAVRDALAAFKAPRA